MSSFNSSEVADQAYHASHCAVEFTIDIYDADDRKWRDSGEGPFSSLESAQQFADDEVGMKYRIISRRA